MSKNAMQEMDPTQKTTLYYQPKDIAEPRMDLEISADETTALLKLHPGKKKGFVLQTAQVYEFLAQSGVVYGIDEEALNNAILDLNTKQKPVEVIIATATEPEAAVAQHIAVNSAIFEKEKTETEQSSIDWKEIKNYQLVDKGTILAELVPEVQGRTGMSITGKELPFTTLQKPQYKPGINVELDGAFYKASVTGKIFLKENIFGVEEVFRIETDVDYHTGNIVFPGDVIIEKNICPGFSVQSGKSIFVQGNIDAQYVSCSGNLVCKQGIIGHGESYAKIGGNCTAKFIERMNIAVRGDLIVESAIVASKVYCLGKIQMGNKGKIVGGEIYATHGIQCSRVGNKIGTPTKIILGIDFISEQKLKMASNNLQKLSVELQFLKKQTQTPATIAKIQKIQSLVEKYLVLITSLSNKVDIYDAAELNVQDSLFPEVLLKICQVELYIKTEYTAKHFHLDKTKGKIDIKQSETEQKRK